MGEKIIVGPIDRGLRNDRIPVVIDNDSFPTLINAYQWRGRVKRKRGTSLLGRLKRFFNSNSLSYSSTSSFNLIAGAGNLFSGFSLEANGNIVPGSISILIAGNTYTDPGLDGILVGSPGGSGTVNYASGDITIAGGGVSAVSGSFNYYPDLPVMGLEEFQIDTTQFPGTIAFDTTYSYNINTSSPFSIYDVSFYKNPIADPILLPGYIPKSVITPTSWNGQDYQQFWTTNYQGAFWATNGINIPFSINNIGMQYKLITGITIVVAGPPAIANITIIGHGLVQGDFLFINEVIGITGINFQTGYVISANPQNPNIVQVEFPFATLGGAYVSGGIAQYLTNRSNPLIDSLRWYDGDPTNGNASTPILNGNKGWVNFAPPLSQADFSIADLPPDQYYLVGARMIVPFKDRLLFLGPVVQTSTDGSQIYLQDTVIYSQNGTPYYTASFKAGLNYPLPPLTTPPGYSQVLVPINQTATPSAYFEDSTGFGGFVTAGLDEPLITCSDNEDVLIMGFNTIQTRFIYTGNDIIPFTFYIINSELGSGSTFSVINMDKGVITRGDRGFPLTSQTGAQRIDLEIPDEVFEMRLLDNGTERVTAQRDYINEWIYFTYPVNNINTKFPSQTLQYNYRDDTWAIFVESYTTYGQFRKRTGFTWATVGETYPSWSEWNDPWNAGTSTLLQPKVIAGNQQGFVLFRDSGTDEADSLYIKSFSASLVTSPEHGLNNGDYITINGVLGTIGAQVNGKVFSVVILNGMMNSFTLNPGITAGTYLGGGTIQRMYVPFVQTKQFPVAWGMARKTRLGVQQYLFTRTVNAQIQLLIFLSQNDSTPYNEGPIVPAINSTNNSLIYSTTLFTCPESTNLGLTPANINLNMVTAKTQDRIWHRKNTSLLGDTIQIGFTLSDAQMRTLDADGKFISQFAEIELHGFILDVTPSSLLA